MKLNLGAGTNILSGWVNHDADVDITRRLPYADGSADAIFAEHVVEHITPQQAWGFFDECLRVLRPGGFVRIAVPSISRIARLSTPEYERFCFDRGFSLAPTRSAAVKAIVFSHGHQSTWTESVLTTFLCSVGFRDVCTVGVEGSRHGLAGVNGHGRVIGKEFNAIETIVAEGVK